MHKLVAPVAVVMAALLVACGGGSDAEPPAGGTPGRSPAATRTAQADPTDTPQPAATPSATDAPQGRATASAPTPTRPAQQPGAGAPTPAVPAPAPTAPPPPTQPIPQSLTISARDVKFVPSQLVATTQSTIAVLFINEDAGVAHDIVVYGPAGGLVTQSQIITGPSQTQVTFAAATPGDYFFKCSLHPWTMTGSISIH